MFRNKLQEKQNFYFNYNSNSNNIFQNKPDPQTLEKMENEKKEKKKRKYYQKN
jgi:hypothetical protein